MTPEELDKALTRVVDLSAALTNALALGVPAMYEEQREDLASELARLNESAGKLFDKVWRMRHSERERYHRELRSFRAEMDRDGTLDEYEDFLSRRGEE